LYGACPHQFPLRKGWHKARANNNALLELFYIANERKDENSYGGE